MGSFLFYKKDIFINKIFSRKSNIFLFATCFKMKILLKEIFTTFNFFSNTLKDFA